jgi:RNA polymerase sigma factor (sigma-70 family)
MAGGVFSDFLHRLGKQASPHGVAEDTDAALLERFVARREEAAFEALVRRHGPMVLGLCRRLLADVQDAEDAFQATFLVLVRKAGSLRQGKLLAGWLYRVAHRIAVRARVVAARRRGRERQGVEMAQARPGGAEGDADLGPLLHEEVNRLPEKYRVPVLLCYLQGRTNEQAARELAWPVGTVKGRLTRARALLRGRLARRGVGLSVGILGAALTQSLAPAALPPALLARTIRSAVLTAAGQQTAGVVSIQAAALTKGALRTMFWKRLALVGVVLLGLAGAGAGLLLSQGRAAGQPEAKQTRQARAKGEAEAIREGKKRLQRLANAMHDYASTHGQLPPAAIVSKAGKPLLSWRVLLLPYLGEDKLFKQFKLDEPWDSAPNKKLLAKMPRLYAPTGARPKEPGTTPFLVFTGKGTVFEGNRGARITDISDGTSATVLIVEASKAVPWTKPEDLPIEAGKPLPRLGGRFEAGFLIAFADGSVFLGKKDFDQDTMRAAITRNGGEVLDPDKLKAQEKP